MADAIQVPQDASAEAQAVLKELQEEGHQIDGLTPETQPDKSTEAKTDDSVKPEEAKAEEATKAQAEVPDESRKPEREPKYVPVGKHNEERHKRQEAERLATDAVKRAEEAERALAAYADKPKTDDIETKARRLAEKHGIDEEFAKDLLTEVTPKQTLPPELEADMRLIKEQRALLEARASEAKQLAAYDTEFAQVLNEFPDLADRKEDLKQLAFSEGNINTSLRRLVLEYRHDNGLDVKGRKTAESPVQGKKTGTEVIDFANITEEQFASLSYSQMDDYEKWQQKNK